MANKSTGVYVIDKFNKPYELNEYQLFVRTECARLKKEGIRIPGRGNTLVYIAELWQKKKLNQLIKVDGYAKLTAGTAPGLNPVIAPVPLKNQDAEKAKEDEMICYAAIQYSNIIISAFNANKNIYLSNLPQVKRFQGVQV